MAVGSALHGKLTTSNGIHIAYQWVFADATARAATVDPNTGVAYQSTEVGKFARQLDDDSIWMLTATTPTWVGVSANAAITGLTDGSLTWDDTNSKLDVAGDIVVSDGAGGAKVTLKSTGIINYNGTMGNSTKDPTVDAPADWVQVEISGTTYYLPAYTA